MKGLAVFTEALTVIAGHHHGLWSVRLLLEGLNQPSQLLIHGRDLTKIRIPGVLSTEWLRRFVRMVRVEVVHPDEQRPAGLLAQKGEGPLSGVGIRSFRSAWRHLIVVQVESTGESESASQDEGGHERRRAIPGLAEPLGQDGIGCRQESAVLVDQVAGWIEPRHDRSV